MDIIPIRRNEKPTLGLIFGNLPEQVNEEQKGIRETAREREPDFVPVIVGNSLNAQSYAREFYDAYDKKTILITNDILWTVKNSAYVEIHPEEDNLLNNFIKIQNMVEEGTQLLIISTNDAGVETLIELRDNGLLLNNWRTFYPDAETFNTLTKKGEFSRIASEIGIPHPLTIEFDLSGDIPELGSIILEGPLWIKPSHRPEWNEQEFENQKKAYRVENIEEAEQILVNAAEHGFSGHCVVQEEIPGDDDQLVSIDIYCENGKARVISSGRKLLEQKGKKTIGNALSILSGNVPQQGIDDAVRLLEHIGWNGWANIDGKIDVRTGQVVFFEVNPRLGRSHYYITASGYPAITPYVQQLFNEEISKPVFRDNILFSSVPFEIVKDSLTDCEIIDIVSKIDDSDVYNPLFSKEDSDVERLVVIQEAMDKCWWLE